MEIILGVVMFTLIVLVLSGLILAARSKLVNAGDYKFKQIASEKLLIVVTSTQGEGEPPEEAVALHKFLFSKKAPKLENTAFAVFCRLRPR